MQNTTPRKEGTQAVDSDSRLTDAARWAAEALELEAVKLLPVSGDASFRRYFRLHTDERSIILMDAPPDQEDSRPFVEVAKRLRRAGVNTPEILQFDFKQGFGLLEDLGDELYRNILTPQSVSSLFPDLFETLSQMALKADAQGLPPCDSRHLQSELDLFSDWYLQHHKNLFLSSSEQREWTAACTLLKENALQQPQVFVHRDFHSCNLLFQAGKPPGVIDFQDAVQGPVSYDLVSLLWDRYISWPREQLETWMESMRIQLGIDAGEHQWKRWCDLMGLQRNLKIVGIFARLHYRDNKHGYLEMIPRFYDYLLDVVPSYPELAPLKAFLERPECAP